MLNLLGDYLNKINNNAGNFDNKCMVFNKNIFMCFGG